MFLSPAFALSKSDSPLLLSLHEYRKQFFSCKFAHLLRSWIPNIPDIATNAGLELLDHEIIPMKDEVRPHWTLSTILGVEEGASKSGGTKVDETRGIIEAMQEEIASGTSIDADFFCMVARKPL